LEAAVAVAVAVVVVVEAVGQSSLSFLGSQLDGNTTPAGCKFFLLFCVLWKGGLKM
jgi:hypothetical protein